MKSLNEHNLSWTAVVSLAIFLFGMAIFIFGMGFYLLPQDEVSPVPPVIKLTLTPTSTLIPTILATPTLLPTSTATPTSTRTKTPTIKSTSTSTAIPIPTLTPTLVLLPDFALTHEIQPGQHLTGISLHYYGTGRRWDDIYEATNARSGEGRYRKIEDPNLIFPDDLLSIPIDVSE